MPESGDETVLVLSGNRSNKFYHTRRCLAVRARDTTPKHVPAASIVPFAEECAHCRGDVARPTPNPSGEERELSVPTGKPDSNVHMGAVWTQTRGFVEPSADPSDPHA